MQILIKTARRIGSHEVHGGDVGELTKSQQSRGGRGEQVSTRSGKDGGMSGASGENDLISEVLRSIFSKSRGVVSP